jgi:hypothetical protein
MPWNMAASSSVHSGGWGMPAGGSLPSAMHSTRNSFMRGSLDQRRRLTTDSPLQRNLGALDRIDSIEPDGYLEAFDHYIQDVEYAAFENYEIAMDNEIAQSQEEQTFSQDAKTFLELIRKGISHKQENFDEPRITFEELIPPGSSHKIAAEAFYQALTIATNNQIHVEQPKTYGHIWFRIS